MTDDFTHRVLTLFAAHDCHESVWWRVDDGEISFYVLCSDVFVWGLADLEQVNPVDLPGLEQAFADARAALDHAVDWAPELWVARKRGMRPQGAWYEHVPSELWPLFDACGPKRRVEMGNPHTHPRTAGVQFTASDDPAGVSS